MAVIVRGTHQLCREAFFDREFHDFAGGSVAWTMRFDVIAERLLDWRGRPRSGYAAAYGGGNRIIWRVRRR
jgi:hypothetical protein